MYFMNSDGTIKSQQQPQQPVVKEDFRHNGDESRRKKRKIVHEFNLFKRHPKCDCTNCWKNFILTIIFYAIVIYILYHIVNFIFSLTDKNKTLTTEELPTSL